MTPLNILVVCDDNLLDSVVYDVHLISEALSIKGDNVVIACSSRSAKSILRVSHSKLQRVYPHSSANLYQFPYIKIPVINWIFGLFASNFLIKKLIKEHSIDVILLYSVLFTGLPAVFAAKKKSIPLVFRNIDMLSQLTSSIVKRWLVYILERFVYQRVDHLFALSERYRSYLIFCGAPKKKISILRFPVSIAFFAEPGDLSEIRDCWGITENDFVVLYMGHLYLFSGLIDFLYLVPNLRKRIPNLKLVVVGGGELTSKLNDLRGRLGIEESVILTGVQPFYLMPKFLGIANICINVYNLKGPLKNLFSAKIIQYMASGRPIISLNQRGMQSKFFGKQEGILYADSVEMMADLILKLRSNINITQKMGRKNKTEASQMYCIDRVIPLFREKLLEIVKQKLYGKSFNK